jgi:ribosome-associated toxin RatA of RatAB toxin-antitoxin module
MKTVHKSVLIWYSAEEMFALVTDVTKYPQFLPWCNHARILSRESDGLTAEVGMAISGIRQSFVTKNTHTEGRKVRLSLVKGPFSHLSGEWCFQPLVDNAAIPGVDGATDQRACRVDLTLDYRFDNRALATLIGPVFDRIAGSLVDAFVKRAEQVYQ